MPRSNFVNFTVFAITPQRQNFERIIVGVHVHVDKDSPTVRLHENSHYALHFKFLGQTLKNFILFAICYITTEHKQNRDFRMLKFNHIPNISDIQFQGQILGILPVSNCSTMAEIGSQIFLACCNMSTRDVIPSTFSQIVNDIDPHFE